MTLKHFLPLILLPTYYKILFFQFSQFTGWNQLDLLSHQPVDSKTWNSPELFLDSPINKILRNGLVMARFVNNKSNLGLFYSGK